MKALIVAESEPVLSASSLLLGEKGCEVIKYRWLLKALDNIEEIDPQIIIISAMDYPRHWKTFVQFINSTYSSTKPHIFLFSSDLMGENEIRKAKWLGVKGIVKSFDLKEDKEIIFAVLPETSHSLRLTVPGFKNTVPAKKTSLETITKKEDTSKEPPKTSIQISEPAAISDDTLKIMFSNPHNNIMITGKVLLIKGNTILYICDNSSTLVNLKAGDCIHNCMIKKNNRIFKKTCKIVSVNNLELKMEIEEWV